jgi:hypothetical protein
MMESGDLAVVEPLGIVAKEHFQAEMVEMVEMA